MHGQYALRNITSVEPYPRSVETNRIYTTPTEQDLVTAVEKLED
jgi:hypothetical protein